jgi:hypothetical protein
VSQSRHFIIVYKIVSVNRIEIFKFSVQTTYNKQNSLFTFVICFHVFSKETSLEIRAGRGGSALSMRELIKRKHYHWQKKVFIKLPRGNVCIHTHTHTHTHTPVSLSVPKTTAYINYMQLITVNVKVNLSLYFD